MFRPLSTWNESVGSSSKNSRKKATWEFTEIDFDTHTPCSWLSTLWSWCYSLWYNLTFPLLSDLLIKQQIYRKRIYFLELKMRQFSHALRRMSKLTPVHEKSMAPVSSIKPVNLESPNIRDVPYCVILVRVVLGRQHLMKISNHTYTALSKFCCGWYGIAR